MALDDRGARSASFGVVLLSNAIQVDPSPDVRARHARSLGVSDLDYPNRRLLAAAERDGYPALDLVPPLRAFAERTGTDLHGFDNTELGTGHWNAEGHRIAAREIARWICDGGLSQ